MISTVKYAIKTIVINIIQFYTYTIKKKKLFKLLNKKFSYAKGKL